MKNVFHVVGVMSGTSLDGIDLVYVKFENKHQLQFEILNAETVSYPKKWYDILKGLIEKDIDTLKTVDEDYTTFLAEIINQFIAKHYLKDIDAVCSHGHTALHQPEQNLTYQIGNLPKLATLINQKVVCDFRVQDVAFGGQGAPLVPIGDKLLFSDYDYCINLGGFANISTEISNARIAYDICPVNIVLNHYVKPLGFSYDDGGEIAKSGDVNQELLAELNQLPFYSKSYPKSLGLEWVNKTVFPIIDAYKLETTNVLRTFVEHIVVQLAAEINKKNNANVLVTGGGAYNSFLMKALKTKTNNKIVIPKPSVVEFKEALIFGLLGVLKLTKQVNCLKSVTGASKNHSSGKIYLP
ncbi:anhydro-N-acetylmuramic acid kinase [Tamlana nanhaiensis]|uniref:Anhydro-N-acetylmuramic acid kinase n=1 Tax=Neotamlana nanhaiensis TaxID=1382798 RepID=A0A0D7VXE1_9FLAO|nr:anhydro-N-acetylmuramic acid kinase [Tamlana nanhaiensis]KJD31555.1 anhydro-N-acetylmuramic acid kinase [Tamlana nanhaiensis]